ncbi:MAG: hypothetical protein DWQ05_07360 [Calditrichaeota bacterium]|nr:MAG: hypothetical protein DWQ05_07360 [Calditrichota bacterium]
MSSDSQSISSVSLIFKAKCIERCDREGATAPSIRPEKSPGLLRMLIVVLVGEMQEKLQKKHLECFAEFQAKCIERCDREGATAPSIRPEKSSGLRRMLIVVLVREMQEKLQKKHLECFADFQAICIERCDREGATAPSIRPEKSPGLRRMLIVELI